MRSMKKGLAVALSMALVVSALSATPVEAAKKPKLSKKKITVKVGSTAKLTVKNAKKSTKINWKTSNKKVAKITKKRTKGKKAYAKIKGMKAGTAKITATYKSGKKKKKLTCTVKVTAKKLTTSAPSGTAFVNTSSAPKGSPTVTGAADASSAPSASAAASKEPSEETGEPVQTTAAETEAPAEPTDTPEPTVKPTFAPSTQDYEFFNDYTLGYSNGIVAYQDGKKVSLADAGAQVYNKKTDNIFAQNIPNNNWWEDKITLTQPLQYTTGDGTAHDIDSMLTNFDFIADPTAIDNSENDGKLYVYGTTEGFTYSAGELSKNAYDNHSLTIVSTEDMVNWTDEGTLDNQNLTNLPSSAASKEKVKNKWGTKAWAPSGLKIDGDGDGEDEYYIFYTNGGAVGYVQGDSPTGPWKDDLGKVLFNQSTPNCKDVKWCFDPAVLVDDKGDAYVYFGGGVWGDNQQEKDDHPDATTASPKTGRVCKIKFEEGTGKVLLDGEPQVLDNYYMFEDSEINQFDGKYYYSYCTNFSVPGNDKWVGSGEIAAYVSTDPMNISFNPTGADGDKFTDADGIYHHYLGSILHNPSEIYGESYNNHHHMQSFKGHNYIFYHSTVLGNLLFRDNKQYRNLHVDEIQIDADTDEVTIEPSYEGARQIEAFNPYKNADGSTRYINATTAAKSAGVKSTRDDIMAVSGSSVNGSPMVLDEIDTGDWTCIKGVDFGEEGMKNFGVEYLSDSDAGRIEMFIDSPTSLENKVASIDILEPTNRKYEFRNVEVKEPVTGKHDVYFVFRGNGYKVASWILSQNAEGDTPDVSSRPEPAPESTPGPVIVTGWNADKTEYILPITEEYVKPDGGCTIEFDENAGSVTGAYNPQYPGIWFNIPDDAAGKFSSIEFTYKDSTEGGYGKAVRYSDSTADEEIDWGGKFMAGEGEQKESFALDSTKTFTKFKIFRNDGIEDTDCYLTITSVVLKK